MLANDEFVSVPEKLTEVGIEIQVLLSSLPPQFDNFVIAMKTRDDLPKFVLLKQKLLEEFNRRKEESNSKSTQLKSQQHAFAVKPDFKSKDNKKNPKSFKVRCFSCGSLRQ